MLSYLYAIAAARAVDQICAVDVDGDMVDLHPAFALAAAATPVVGAIALAAACVFAREKDKVARLKM